MIDLEIVSGITAGVILIIAYMVIRAKQRSLSRRLDVIEPPEISSAVNLHCPEGSIVVLEFPGMLHPEALKQMRKTWERASEDLANTWIVVLEGGLRIGAVLTETEQPGSVSLVRDEHGGYTLKNDGEQET